MTEEAFDQQSQLEGVTIRFGQPADLAHLKAWMADPEVIRSCPVGEPKEVEEAAERWFEYNKQKGVLIADYQGQPVGIAILFLQTYERLIHQAMHILIVAPAYRRMGIGSALLQDLLHLGKSRFGVELAHVEVYGDPDAVAFYRKRGFAIFARQERWIKEGEHYLDRVCLECYV